jgi:peptidoglycan/LPS O-acetylase OafA/YrhL
MSHKGELEVVVRSFLLLPAPRHVVGVAWTLIYELWFYLLFGALFFRSSRLFFVALGTWTALAYAKVMTGWSPASYALAFALNPIVGEFLLGCLASLAFERGRSRHAGWVLAVGLAGLAVGWGFALGGAPVLPRELAFGLPASLIVYAAAHVREVRSRVLIFLGDASYSTYLVHGTAISVLVKLLRAAGVERLPGGWLGSVAVLGAALALCSVFYLVVERPLLAACRRRLLPASAAR